MLKIMSNLRNHSVNCMKQGAYAVLGAVQTTNLNSKHHQTVRTFSRTSQLAKSKDFYDDLEIPRTATQSEIKSAYYTLSMFYHPDKNKTEQAHEKFRRITEAYEVLGNFRTRRMYDKGIGSFSRNNITHSPGGVDTEIINEEVEDDAQTKFYKQHMVKSQPPVMADRVSARDLDKWSADRITTSFQHMQKVKRILKEREEDKQLAVERAQSMGFIFYTVILIVCGTVIYEYIYEKRHNEQRQKLSQKNS